MTRTSTLDQSLGALDPSVVGDEAASQAAATAMGRGGWGSVGLKGLAKGGLAGAVGYGLTDYAWGAASNAIKGQMGVLKEMVSDIGKIGTEISKQMQDPSFAQYGQRIQQIVAQAVPQLGIAPAAQTSGGTPTTPGVRPPTAASPAISPLASMASQVQALSATLSQIEDRIGRVEASRSV